jgi:tRNA threonylcarbamoyladenosine biosynthesis protein TsaE
MAKIRTETKVVRTNSEIETERLGMFLGHRITGDLCVSLVGALGSGKSVLVRGICRGLGVDEDVLSPTFILYEEYNGRLPVIHLDLYRLEHEREIEELGVFDRFGDGSVILVEWGDRSERILGESDIVINIEMIGETERTVGFGYSKVSADLVEGLIEGP